jgi:hypothetical protein
MSAAYTEAWYREQQGKVRGGVVNTHEKGAVVGMETSAPERPVGRNWPVKALDHVAGSNPAPSPTYQSFFVPGPLPGANDIVRKHHMVYSALKKRWCLTIAQVILVARLKPMQACTIAFRWQEKDNRRDDDNIMFGQKFVLDALRDMQIIPDDRRQFVRSLTHVIVVEPTNPGVLVMLEGGA